MTMEDKEFMHIESTRAFIGTYGSTSGPLCRFWLPVLGWREGESGYTPEWLDDVPSELQDRGICFVVGLCRDMCHVPFHRLLRAWECVAPCPWCEGHGEMSRDEDDPDAESDECPLCEGSGELYDSDKVVCLVPHVPSEDEIARHMRGIPETYDDGEPMDIRLCLWADGRWAIHWGDVGRDLAHAPICIVVEPGQHAHIVFSDLLEALEAHLSELQGEYDAAVA